jgi:cytochrome c553
MNTKYLCLAASLGLALAACANLERSRDLANPNVSGKVMAAQLCSQCHGVDGNSISPAFPKLAAQQKSYFINQMKGFRDKQRSDPAGEEYMWGLSRHLTDKQIDELADYFSSHASRPVASPIAAQDLAAGKDIFEKGFPEKQVIACTTCHGPQAEGIDTIPRLAGQHYDYIVKQLNVFQLNQGRPGTPMETVSHSLTDENKAAVAAYLQSLVK